MAAWLFALALFGYPIVGNLVAILQIDSRAVSIPFRVAVGVLALLTLLLPGRLRFDPWRACLLLVFAGYIVRLSYDTAVADIEGAEYALQFFLVGSLLPALAIWRLDAYDERRFGRATFVTASVGCLMSLVGHWLGAFGDFDLTGITGRLSTIALNPVSLGYLAVGGLFGGLSLWSTATLGSRIGIVVSSILLLSVLGLTGSKGPALVLLVGLALWSLRRGMFVQVLTLATLVLVLTLVGDNPLAERVAASMDDLSTLDRVDLIESSIRQINAAPWIGSAFVELESGFYAHNILLEAAMSFGLPLTALLVIMLLQGTVVSWRLLGAKGQFVALIFFLGLASSVISSSMYGAAVLWISLVVVLGLQTERRAPVASTRASMLRNDSLTADADGSEK